MSHSLKGLILPGSSKGFSNITGAFSQGGKLESPIDQAFIAPDVIVQAIERKHIMYHSWKQYQWAVYSFMDQKGVFGKYKSS